MMKSSTRPGTSRQRAPPNRARLEPDRAAPPPTAAAEIGSHAGDPDFMASLARGLAVIRGFSQHRARMTIAQLSLRTGIPRASVRRVLHTLSKMGYAGSDDGRTFTLRPQILAIGHAYLTSAPLVTSAQPLLDQVSQRVHESCSMAILDGDEIMYVARSSSSRRIMSIDLGIGSRLPAYCTSMGRVLLAQLPPRELEEYLQRVKLTALTDRTEISKTRFVAILGEIRESGIAIVDQELEIGLRSIAVPVADPGGRVAAAINVSAQAARVSVAEMERQFLPPLRTAARDLGMLLA
ncbi:MAG: IclR family transcriptional regulator C-terminal domain-containing protein [Betaproteobacteria bacterium]